MLAVIISTGTHGNDGKVFGGIGSETRSHSVYLHSHAKNLQITEFRHLDLHTGAPARSRRLRDEPYSLNLALANNGTIAADSDVTLTGSTVRNSGTLVAGSALHVDVASQANDRDELANIAGSGGTQAVDAAPMQQLAAGHLVWGASVRLAVSQQFDIASTFNSQGALRLDGAGATVTIHGQVVSSVGAMLNKDGAAFTNGPARLVRAFRRDGRWMASEFGRRANLVVIDSDQGLAGMRHGRVTVTAATRAKKYPR